MARLMVVEDDEAFAYLVERQLRAAGHEVTLFPDWRGVLETLEGDEGIDVLVTDLRLPPGTPHGVSLGHMARLRRPLLKIVYMTAFADVLVEVREEVPDIVLKGLDGRAVVLAVEAILSA
jgi:DNA-binding NtrC family response regulator